MKKKIFTLLTLALVSLGTAWADDEIIVSLNASPTYELANDDEDLSTKGDKKNKATWADGTSLRIMRGDKDVSSGNNITISGTNYKSIKVSNGAQNKVTLPTGKKAYYVSFYSYVNKDAGETFWAEINGLTVSGGTLSKEVMTNFNNESTPDVMSYDLGGVSEFTFTNSGQQVCYVIIISTVQKSASSLSFESTSGSADMADGTSFTLPTLTKDPADATVTYSSSDTDVATVNSSTGAVTLVHAGETTITASFAGNASYNPSSASYTLTVTNTAVNEINVTYNIAGVDGIEGTAPASFAINEGETFTIPVNQTLYVSGKTLTGWTYNETTYAIGDNVTAQATDMTLTPVFTANAAEAYLGHNASTVTWDFQTKNGAPVIQIQNGQAQQTAILVAQSTIGVNTIDMKLNIDVTTDGKFQNSSNNDWAQANNGTKFIVPVTNGAVVKIFVMAEGSTPVTFGGNNGTYASNIYSYTSTTSGNIEIVMGDQNWARYITVTYPSENEVYNLTENNTEISLTKTNIAANDYLSAATNNWTSTQTYRGFTGYFYNMSSTGRKLTIKVKGANCFAVYVQNGTANRQYTVKVGNNDAETVTHGGTGVELSKIFAISDPAVNTTIVLEGNGSGSVYPVSIVFNPTVSATIASSGYSTFCSSYPLNCASLPDGLTAYQIKAANISGSTITPTQVTAAVPAGTGLLLKGTAGADYDIPVAASGTALNDNKLVGVTTATAIGGASTVYHYILKDGAFYHASAGTLAAGKAYLSLDAAPSSARSLVLMFDEAENTTTGINAVKGVEANGAVYNMNGQRVAQPTKGLYIINGKKVVIK